MMLRRACAGGRHLRPARNFIQRAQAAAACALDEIMKLTWPSQPALSWPDWGLFRKLAAYRPAGRYAASLRNSPQNTPV